MIRIQLAENVRRVAIIVGVLLAIAVLTGRGISGLADQPIGSDEHQRVETILRYQQAYFENIRSVDLHASLSVNYSEAAQRALQAQARGANASPSSLRGWEQQSHFVADEDRYLVESHGIVGAPDSVDVVAWDRTRYQTLSSEEGHILLRIVDNAPTDSDSGVANPLLMPYGFVFALQPGFQKHWQSLHGLRNRDAWFELLALAMDCKEETRLGHRGTTIKFQRADGPMAEVFFAADRYYQPLYWKVSNPTRVPELPEMEHYEVKSDMELAVPNGMIMIPLLASQVTNNGQEYVYQIDPSTLRINVPLNDAMFALPDSIKYWHTDGHILYEPSVIVAKRPSLAGVLLSCVYNGSLTRALQQFLDKPLLKDYADSVVSTAGASLRRRFGGVRELSLMSADEQAAAITTVWIVAAERGDFEMRMQLNTWSRIEGVWFRLEEDGEWRSLVELGSEEH